MPCSHRATPGARGVSVESQHGVGDSDLSGATGTPLQGVSALAARGQQIACRFSEWDGFGDARPNWVAQRALWRDGVWRRESGPTRGLARPSSSSRSREIPLRGERCPLQVLGEAFVVSEARSKYLARP